VLASGAMHRTDVGKVGDDGPRRDAGAEQGHGEDERTREKTETTDDPMWKRHTRHPFSWWRTARAHSSPVAAGAMRPPAGGQLPATKEKYSQGGRTLGMSMSRVKLVGETLDIRAICYSPPA
jgi:hypothetical protein